MYLPLNNCHIVSINGIQPDQIKKSAKNVVKDREKIKHCTCLNATCNALGFTGGFSGYAKEFENELEPFLKKKGMITPTDLITPRMKCKLQVGRTQLNRRDVSDRLFKSAKQIPQKIFTGYNYDYLSKYDDGHYYFYSEQCLNFDYGIDPRDLDKNLSFAYENPDLIVKGRKGWIDKKLMDVVVGGLMSMIDPSFNLIGDSLIEPMLGD